LLGAVLVSVDAMAKQQFRLAYFSAKYEGTVAFYRDGLELLVLESWDRGEHDRGTLFAAAAGVIEVLARPKVGEPLSLFWDDRPPQGVFMVLEVEAVDDHFRRAVAKGLPIKQELTDQRWGHRSFCLLEPNGLTLYIFSAIPSPRA
jgi:hypothetical protein